MDGPHTLPCLAGLGPSAPAGPAAGTSTPELDKRPDPLSACSLRGEEPSTTSAIEGGSADFLAAFEEALASALTKFDCLEACFARGMSVPAVCEMLEGEMEKDLRGFLSASAPQQRAEVQAKLRKAVGTANGAWRRGGGSSERARAPRPRDSPLPWASIDAYPEWVVGQIMNYASVSVPEEQAAARRALESTLLERPLCAASVKYDGTCFGKLDGGQLVGRRQVLGDMCAEYQQTSTAAAERCDVGALRSALAGMLGAELEAVCVWGELMCNPGYYGYGDRGLASKWLCFGVVAAVAGLGGGGDSAPAPGGAAQRRLQQRLSEELARRGFAHSVSSAGQLRLLLCPALRRLLEGVGCEVAAERCPGATHAGMVAQAATGLAAGEDEGVVLVFTRPDGQASARKWKNSSERGSARAADARLLSRCRELCASLASAGRLDGRVAAMVGAMQRVAEAETIPLKKGRGRVARS